MIVRKGGFVVSDAANPARRLRGGSDLRARAKWRVPHLGWHVGRDGEDTILFRSWFPSALVPPLLGCVLAWAVSVFWILADLPAAGLWMFLFPVLAVLMYRGLAGCVNYSYVRISTTYGVTRWSSPLPWVSDVAVLQRRIAAIGVAPAPPRVRSIEPECEVTLSAPNGTCWPLIRCGTDAQAAIIARQLAAVFSTPVLCDSCGAPLSPEADHCRRCRHEALSAGVAALSGISMPAGGLPLAGFQLGGAAWAPIAPAPPEAARIDLPMGVEDRFLPGVDLAMAEFPQNSVPSRWDSGVDLAPEAVQDFAGA